jgi:hypothetical protein
MSGTGMFSQATGASPGPAQARSGGLSRRHRNLAAGSSGEVRRGRVLVGGAGIWRPAAQARSGAAVVGRAVWRRQDLAAEVKDWVELG